jgi:hypothetical protein
MPTVALSLFMIVAAPGFWEQPRRTDRPDPAAGR